VVEGSGLLLVFAVADNQIVLWVEQHAADVVRVSAHRVNLPRLLARTTRERQQLVNDNN